MIPPGGGDLVWLGPQQAAQFKVLAADTRGAVSIVEQPTLPGCLVAPHAHTDIDQITYVIEGELGFRVADEEVLAQQGAYVLKPKGTPHTFWNASGRPARVMELSFPAGFENFFWDAARLMSEGGGDPERLSEIGRQYREVFEWWDWVPDLRLRYGVKLVGEA